MVGRRKFPKPKNFNIAASVNVSYNFAKLLHFSCHFGAFIKPASFRICICDEWLLTATAAHHQWKTARGSKKGVSKVWNDRPWADRSTDCRQFRFQHSTIARRHSRSAINSVHPKKPKQQQPRNAHWMKCGNRFSNRRYSIIRRWCVYIMTAIEAVWQPPSISMQKLMLMNHWV